MNRGFDVVFVLIFSFLFRPELNSLPLGGKKQKSTVLPPISLAQPSATLLVLYIDQYSNINVTPYCAPLGISMAHTQEKQKPPRASRSPKSISFWKWEVIAAIRSLLFLSALIGILVKYTNNPIFNWHGVTLNAYVSILSTASKTTLLYHTAEAIGQWKWIIYAHHSRPLLDVQWIDAASRGPWGSTKLLRLRRRMSVVVFSIHRVDYTTSFADQPRKTGHFYVSVP